MPYVNGLRNEILEEAHVATYAIHLEGKKMYHDVKTVYWWLRMKRDKAEYVFRCLTC